MVDDRESTVYVTKMAAPTVANDDIGERTLKKWFFGSKGGDRIENTSKMEFVLEPSREQKTKKWHQLVPVHGAGLVMKRLRPQSLIMRM